MSVRASYAPDGVRQGLLDAIDSWAQEAPAGNP
jgi:hypothetical protein